MLSSEESITPNPSLVLADPNDIIRRLAPRFASKCKLTSIALEPNPTFVSFRHGGPPYM